MEAGDDIGEGFHCLFHCSEGRDLWSECGVCPDAERAPVSACGVVVRLHLRRRRTFVESESTHPRSCESGRYECDSHLVWLRGSCNAHSRVSE